MVLDELHGLVVTLQGRIAAHGPALQQSEALTRYALIDPLLRALGWDTGDPSQVVPEFRSASGSADYALLGSDGQPRIILEAKKLGTPLQAAVNQAIGYCIQEGYDYFAVTDGAIWELYETHKPTPLKDKLVIKLDVRGAVSRTSLDALALWRAGVVEGNVAVGVSPVVGGPAPTAPMTPTSDSPVPKLDAAWQALSEFTPQVGKKAGSVRFPDGDIAQWAGWGDFAAEIGGWLHSKNHLTASHVPMVRDGSYIVANKPEYPSGKRFSAARKIGSFYVPVNMVALAIVRNARHMIEQTGQNPADFAVKLQ